jgi:hypothetical protein
LIDIYPFINKNSDILIDVKKNRFNRNKIIQSVLSKNVCYWIINECEKILNAEENKNNNSNSNSSIINNNNISISKDSNSNNNKNRSKKLFKTIIVAATHSDKLNNIQFDSSNINDLVHVLPLCKILCKLTNHINLQSCWTGHNIQKIANECYKINRNIAMSGFDAEIDDHRTFIQWIQTGALLVKPTDKMLHDYLYHFVYGING